ncbi:MAG TPA: FAD-dependent oxidoreductase [Pyrinomonadaceae bacterium]|jgi:glycine/D-amino acid oxidase-like deaminating enzyme/nitrite reductase/ring-hydroxylating ferredoxin subunit|nr:FAD-dependent oxidoreductase [Pyrinomonadaceae bacterium]
MMKTDNGRTTSVWMRTADMPEQSPLAADVQADVVIVGAGIAGLTTAYLLTKEGKRVVILDDGPLAGGETCRTTAHLVNALDERYYELERLHGERGARLAAESHTAAIDQIESIVGAEGIDCDFTRLDGYLFVPPGDDPAQLGEELRAAHRAGLTEVEHVERAPVESFDTGAALRFPRQAQFHILKYLRGLTDAVRRGGGEIHTQTHATKIVGGEEARVETAGGATVRAGAIVVATNSPVNDLVAIHTKQAPYRTFVVGGRVPRGSVPQILLWDTADPYHYVRTQRVQSEGGEGGGYDVLIVGGEDHKTGQADDAEERFRCLEEWTRERFPQVESFEFRWSGQVMEPVDGLAFIGRNPLDSDNVYIATGDSGNGMTHGTIAGMLLTDLISGRENKWAELYDPSRKPLSASAMKDFGQENLNVAAQYTDLVTPGEVSDASEIEPGEGAIIRRGLTKVACHRDASGALHERSAICAHLGCVVRWNSMEKTWDCPCHGSRYQTDGHVVNGPAISGLESAAESNDVSGE